MGAAASSPLKLALLGLQGAGKTTILYRLKERRFMYTTPTLGFNYEVVKANYGKSRAVRCSVWDVSGDEKGRHAWQNYARGSDALLFVVDSTASDSLDEARYELHRMARLPQHFGAPVLVLANKHDLVSALPVEEISRQLDLPALASSHPWEIHATCGVDGSGLEEAIAGLCGLVKTARMAKRKK